jgi:hypothetical protein
MWRRVVYSEFADVSLLCLDLLENENGMFLRNVGKILPDYMPSHREGIVQNLFSLLHIQKIIHFPSLQHTCTGKNGHWVEPSALKISNPPPPPKKEIIPLST